ncbi:MAG: response regulator [Deltaproteobacteria bacterium]|nr:MAG: response regulator [Deltaproteobacteria bacterium]
MAKQIWVIDDDASIRKLLSEALKLRGYQVTTFSRAETALETLETATADLILVDLMLPGQNGIEFCREVRTRPDCADLPLVLMTAFSQRAEELLHEQEPLNILDCLFKPFNLDRLQQRIAEILGQPAPAAARGEITISGDLEETPFAQLLHNLYSLKSTGLLTLVRGSVKKVVYIHNGYPIFARSNLVRECLGQMLVDDGIITTEQCEASLQQVRETGRLQGTVLIDMGLLTPHQLQDVLKQQIVSKLLEIFSWPDGSYQFIQGRDFKKGITRIDLSPAALIYQGIVRHYDQDRIHAILNAKQHLYPCKAQSPAYRYQDMGLDRHGRKVFDLCDGMTTLAGIREQFPLTRRETDQVLAALIVAEMVELLDTPVAEENEESELSAEQAQFRETFLREYGQLMKCNYFELFGVPENAPRAVLRKAYFRMAKKYHPDRFLQTGVSDDLRQKANELFQHLSQAYETLSDPKACSQYRTRLKQEKGEAGPRVEDVLKAETAFQKGRHLNRSRRFAEALKELEICMRYSPEEPEYITQYAWALYRCSKDNPAERERALQLLQKSAYLNAEIDQTHLYLGLILKDQGRDREAEKRFEMAIRCNPDCTEALRELRLYNMRREKEARENRGKGLFGRLLRKD